MACHSRCVAQRGSIRSASPKIHHGRRSRRAGPLAAFQPAAVLKSAGQEIVEWLDQSFPGHARYRIDLRNSPREFQSAADSTGALVGFQQRWRMLWTRASEVNLAIR